MQCDLISSAEFLAMRPNFKCSVSKHCNLNMKIDLRTPNKKLYTFFYHIQNNIIIFNN